MSNQQIEAFRQLLQEKKEELASEPEGNVVLSSHEGPIGIKLVEELFNIVEEQQRQIDRLSKRGPGDRDIAGGL